MDEDGIGLVLARASELRSKITNCIHKSSPLQKEHNATNGDREAEDKNPLQVGESAEDDEDDDEEAESLFNIRDALESLEAQLSSLQALQQQQWYEKGTALAEIDNSRKKLLAKLKDYKGEDLEVIQEATAFASETVEENNDLLLPPYPTRPSNNGYLPHFLSTHKPAQNGLRNGGPTHESGRNQVGPPESRIPLKRARAFINFVAKAVLTIVGVVSVLSMAGFEPRVRKRGAQIKVLGLFQQQVGSEEIGATVRCPPGKVMVVEEGETRCLVKERVEIPFESVASMPNVSYGCG